MQMREILKHLYYIPYDLKIYLLQSLFYFYGHHYILQEDQNMFGHAIIHFLDYLNFEGITRLLPFYMLEGVKALYRLCYAIIKTLKTVILRIKSPDDVIKTVRAKTKARYS
jgi:hypothetical protein